MRYDVVIIGAGPTGLSAAAELGRLGVGRVAVIEREEQAGGIPRHSDHQGFGLRDLHRSYTGPRYAQILLERAVDRGAEVLTSTTAQEIVPGEIHDLTLIAPSGIRQISACRVLLATGARERPRAARLIPGDRGAGVFTTGQLQQWVRDGLPVGSRAVILGAEHVSYSAVLTLRHAGVEVAALVTDLDHHQSVRGARFVAEHLWLAPTLPRHRVVGLRGRRRLEAVVLEDLATGEQREIAADVMVTTGDWIPDNDLARRSGLTLDRATCGPRTDGDGASDIGGLYAAGNLVHPVETADRCARNGRLAARAVARSLVEHRPMASRVNLAVNEPIAWVWPNLIDPMSIPKRLVLRTTTFVRGATVVARQGDRVLGHARLHGGVPNQHTTVRGSILEGCTDIGPVQLELR